MDIKKIKIPENKPSTFAGMHYQPKQNMDEKSH